MKAERFKLRFVVKLNGERLAQEASFDRMTWETMRDPAISVREQAKKAAASCLATLTFEELAKLGPVVDVQVEVTPSFSSWEPFPPESARRFVGVRLTVRVKLRVNVTDVEVIR